MNKNILIIGAGAVGLVYGKYLADGGNNITFLIKEKYKAELSKGATLYNLSKDKNLENPISFINYLLATELEALQATEFQQVYLCFSSVALQAFNFANLKTHLKGEPIIVMFQSGIKDYEVVAQHFNKTQIVQGMISMICYHAPLANETVDKAGVAYWLPPLISTPFSGNAQQCKTIVKTFKQSKIGAGKVKSAAMQALFPSAFLVGFLIALEASNWQFSKLSSNKQMLKDLQLANQQIFNALEKKYKTSVPILFNLINRPTAYRYLLSLAPRLVPLHLENYLKAHFTKVNEQTKMYLKDYLALAKQEGLSNEAIAKFVGLNKS